MTLDEQYMARCLQLARMGESGAWPNPMVGAVLVVGDRIIGEGYHRRCGGPHAEVNAIASVKDAELLSQATLYVSLEPCSHFGKTPPCANLIIEKRIPRVVIGCLDSNPMVYGEGVRRLREAGVQVTTGVLETECRKLNRRFFTVKEKKRPYVILKWAQSQDGFIDRLRGCNEKATCFSNECTLMLVHKLRASVDAVMVGRRTALMDNPSLTTRCWNGKNAVRVVLDRCLELPRSLALFNGEAPTFVIADKRISGVDAAEGVEVLRLNFETDILPSLLSALYERGVQSLLVEGGAQLLQSFINDGLWDETRVETAPFILGAGVKAPVMGGCDEKIVKDAFGHSISLFYRL